jgi:hypothetical protein
MQEIADKINETTGRCASPEKAIEVIIFLRQISNIAYRGNQIDEGITAHAVNGLNDEELYIVPGKVEFSGGSVPDGMSYVGLADSLIENIRVTVRDGNEYKVYLYYPSSTDRFCRRAQNTCPQRPRY